MSKCNLNKVAKQLHILRTSFYKNTSGALFLKREIPLKTTEVKRHVKKETEQKICFFENNLMHANKNQ